MKRVLAFAVLALLLSIAAPRAHACEPADAGGAGTPLRHLITLDGAAGWWWCRGEYDWQLRFLYAPMSIGLVHASLAEARLALESPAAWRAAVLRHFTVRACTITQHDGLEVDADVPGDYWGVCSALHDAIEREGWRVMRWAVVPNVRAADLSRPMYLAQRQAVPATVGDKALATRAPANAPCSCSAQLAIAAGNESNRWCPLPGQDVGAVTLCRRIEQ
jgi:hypothetical protein